MSYSDIYKSRPFAGTELTASAILDGPKLKWPKSILRPASKLFFQFSLLPRELREAIWTSACVDANPRVVEVGFYTIEEPPSSTIVTSYSYHSTYRFRQVTKRYPSKTVVPALLHVSQEARNVGLKHYETFAPDGSWIGTYINWDLDYIYLNWPVNRLRDRLPPR